jgi:hypothetical protein
VLSGHLATCRDVTCRFCRRVTCTLYVRVTCTLYVRVTCTLYVRVTCTLYVRAFTKPNHIGCHPDKKVIFVTLTD